MFGAYGIKEVDVDFLHSRKDDILLIDVRTEAEVSAGAIAGAIHIPLHLLPLKAHEIPQDKPVVIYCRSGARSAQACAFMQQKGYDNMHNLSGGIAAWARAGKPIGQLS
ncbi:MAG: rhodanese-like domain-containing protein [Parasulfuritortus sp.]|jgi:rhodanese-related sulfurtransferase|nr:rhodanese-like domain-containing protein [Parasulfuritortus sp.]